MSESAIRGKPCVAFIVFSGCGADKQGLADVVADISMLTPDGKVLGEKKAVEKKLEEALKGAAAGARCRRSSAARCRSAAGG